MKNNIQMIPITPHDVFAMIEDFADCLLTTLRQQDHPQALNNEFQLEAYRKILTICADMDIEGRLAIIILLNGACAMVKTAQDQERNRVCPPQRLN